MPNLTDGSIRQALKRVEQRQKEEALVDGEGRGTGRLVLSIRPTATRVIAQWMAQQWRGGKRTKRKIGDYPSVSLSDAREIFKRDFSDSIQKGRNIKITTDTRPGTLGDLFAAYVASLKSAGKKSWRDTDQCLDKVAEILGRNRPARSIEPDEIVEAIRPIYERNARSMADHVRSYIRSAYSWGLKSEHETTAVLRRAAFSWWATRLLEFRPSPKWPVRAGWTNKNFCSFTNGSNAPTFQFIRPTHERSSSSC